MHNDDTDLVRKRTPTCGRCIIALAIGILVGCDDFPGADATQLTETPDAVELQGRGGYDWKVRGGRFEVARPTDFKFVEKLDLQTLKKNLDIPKFVEPTRPGRPDWMEDDFYNWYRRYSEPHWQPQTVFEVDLGNASSQARACMNSDGSRMCVVTDKLVEWDLKTDQVIHTHELPFSDLRPFAYDDVEDSILLNNTEKIVSLRLADGQVEHQWQLAAGKIVNAVRARGADLIAVVTSEKGLMAIADNLTTLLTYRGEGLDSPRVAIHPDGKWILGIIPTGFVRWRLDKAGYPAEVIIPVQAMVNSKCIPVSGKYFDRFVDPFFFFEVELEPSREVLNRAVTPNFLPSCVNLDAVAATTNGSQDWLVILAHKGDFSGNLRTYLQDFSLQSLDYSLPWEVPFEDGFKILASDWSVQRIAFLVGTSLKVVERRAWVEPTGRNLMQVMREKFSEGRVAEIESLVTMLRAQKVHRFEKTGEQVFAQFVAALGDQWASMENPLEPASQDTLEPIEQWHAAGSELAKLVSIRRHINTAVDARGLGESRTVTSRGWQVLATSMGMAREEIQDLLTTNKISLPLMCAFIDSARYSNIPMADCEPFLKQSIELYPQSTECIISTCISSLPRWGGNEGEGGALVAAIADNYPVAAGEILYAKVALGMVSIFGEPILAPTESGFSLSRVLSNSEHLLERGIMTRTETESLMGLARSAGKLEYIDRLAKYHYQSFGIIGSGGYRTDILQKLAKTRDQAFPADYDPVK